MGIQNYAQVCNSGNPIRSCFWHRGSGPCRDRIKVPKDQLASVEYNDEALCLNLNLIDEKRDQVLKCTEDYQSKTARYYDQKVKLRSYKPGDLVLKKLLPVRKNPTHGKLRPNWEGPYIVSRVIRLGNYKLQTEEGKILPHSWNAEHLKLFLSIDLRM